MPQPVTRLRSPRMDMVRSMLADRANRSESAPAPKRHSPQEAAADRRRLWQERLAQYVREPDGR